VLVLAYQELPIPQMSSGQTNKSVYAMELHLVV